MSDIQACAEIVLKADPDRFAAVMAAPVAAREKLFPIHAFAVEVARAPWASEEPMIAEMRLQWWRDGLSEIASGALVSKHEVLSPLSGVLTADTAKALDGFVEVRRWDIYKEPFEDDAHLDDYLQQTGGAFYQALCQALGASDASAGAFGYAVAVANWLKAVPELEARGRVPLVDGRPDAVRSLAEKAIASLQSVRRAGIDRAARPAFLAGWQTETILKQVARSPSRVADGTLGQSEFAKKASLLMKVALGRV